MFYEGSLQVDVPTDRHIVTTRIVHAPRALVFEALIRPELLAAWMGPRGWQLDVCEADARIGGTYRFRVRGPCGTTIRWHGVYLDMVYAEHLVQAESFDDWLAEASVVTTVLREEDRHTTITASVRYPSQRLRDAVLNAGMLRGTAEAYGKLDELLCAGVAAA